MLHFKPLLRRRSGERVRRRTEIALIGRYETLESRVMLAADFGDAPDLGPGTAAGDYETLAAHGGASHVIDATQLTLFIGNRVDADDGTLQDATATADDRDGLPADDEDGVLDSLDLVGTIGGVPTVTLLVTNQTGVDATLAGWIDYNNDGQFDNVTERTIAAVVDGTANGRLTLTFPAIPFGWTGDTVARFRISTDATFVSNPIATGSATDGEVEDHIFSIQGRTTGMVESHVKISDGLTGFTPANLGQSEFFGSAVTSLGDLNGDGVIDLAVGATWDGNDHVAEGAVYILFMNSNGTVESDVKISDGLAGFHPDGLVTYDWFGNAVAGIGDLDGDGVVDLAVGAYGDENLNVSEGAVYILFLNQDGTVKSHTKISNGLSGFTPDHHFTVGSNFGKSVTSFSDLDGDGVRELVVGAWSDGNNNTHEGAVYVLFMNPDGTVKSDRKISDGLHGFLPSNLEQQDQFGTSVARLGDIDGDGVTDLAVGARIDENTEHAEGAVYVLMMNGDGSVKEHTKISDGLGGFMPSGLESQDHFGSSLAGPGDLDGDGIGDLVVGAEQDEKNQSREGAVYILLLNRDGTVKRHTKMSDDLAGFDPESLDQQDAFGSGVASLGDLNGDGVTDLAVGAMRDENAESAEGALYVLFLGNVPEDFGDAPDGTPGTGAGDYQTTGTNLGPSHVIDPGLLLGSLVDGDNGVLQNVTADADDVIGDPDDEDSVQNPADLTAQVGESPKVTITVTNTTGRDAAVGAWIDFNGNGIFENIQERAAQLIVPDGTVNELVTLRFNQVPAGSAGSTYARIRIGTEPVFFFSPYATGPLSDGEVEDYVFTITEAPADLTGKSFNVVNDHVLNGQANVTFTVENSGFGSAGPFQTHLVWSANDVVGDGDDVVVSGSSEIFTSLAAGTSATRSVTAQLDKAALYANSLMNDPAGQAVGAQSQDVSRLFLVVDVLNEVTESDETNNRGIGHLVDNDDITYFPWDTDGNGTVTPIEALQVIQAINTSNTTHDFDGNGIVTPLEALSVLQRIGYVRNNGAVAAARGFGSTTEQPTALASAVAPGQTEDTVAGFVNDTFPTYSNPADDEEEASAFAVDSSEVPVLLPPATDDSNATENGVFATTEWLDVI